MKRLISLEYALISICLFRYLSYPKVLSESETPEFLK